MIAQAIVSQYQVMMDYKAGIIPSTPRC
jgi:hypothetical protein